MKLSSITIKSISRRKSKSVFLALGVILSISSVITLIDISQNVNASIAANLDEFGANILIMPKSEDVNLSYAGISISGTSYQDNELTADDALKIKRIKNKDNISIIAPKLLNIEIIKGKKVVINGIDFSAEIKLKKWWKVIGEYPITKNQILIGSEAAKKYDLHTGDQLSIRNNNYLISGTLEETGSPDDEMIFIDINEARLIFNKENKISFIEVAALCYDCPIEEIVSQTSAMLPGVKVTPIKQAIESKMAAIHSFEHFAMGISVVILVISILIVFVNVNASVNERTGEIGIFKAVGFRNSHIIKVVLYEITIISIISGIIGYVISLPLTAIITPLLTMEGNSGVVFNFEFLYLAIILSVGVGILAGIYPAYRATKLDPTVAFRAL